MIKEEYQISLHWRMFSPLTIDACTLVLLYQVMFNAVWRWLFASTHRILSSDDECDAAMEISISETNFRPKELILLLLSLRC